MKNRTLATMAVVVALAAAVPTARGVDYAWTGTDSSDLNVDNNWAGGTQPAGIGSGQPSTPAIGDRLIFDSNTWVTKPRRLYTRTTSKWGSIWLKNGTIDWANDSNNQGNYSWGGTNTLVVGDGDATAAEAQFNVQRWNQGGTAGAKTYIIDSDGTLSSGRGGTHIWSNGASYDTVMRLLGGAVSITGELTESEFAPTDSGDYVVFEALGSTFTFTKGSAAGRFDEESDITGAIGDTLAFRAPDAGIDLDVTDNGTTWTITAVEAVVATPGTLIYGK